MLMRVTLIGLAFFIFSCKSSQITTAQENTQESEPITQDFVEVDSTSYHPIKDYRSSNSRSFDLLHTTLHLSFNWEKQHVNGKAHLKLRPYFYEQETLVLDAKGLEILRVGMIDGLDTTSLMFEYPNDQVYIELGRNFTRNEELDIFIQYIAKPNERTLGGSDAITSDKGLYFINPTGEEPNKPRQIWTQGETECNSAWFPTIDSPNERCTQEMYLTVSDSLTTLSNGELISSVKNSNGFRIDHWKLDKPHAPYLFMLAIGQFDVVEDNTGKVPFKYLLEPGYGQYAKDIFGNTPEMLSYFEDLLGVDYPWGTYSQVVVRDFVSGAMENTTASIFMDDLRMTDKELLDENWDYIIAHELIHQWFGNLVTCESWSNLPMNESFANFGEYLWIGHKYGKDEGDYHAMLEEDSYLEESQSKMVNVIRHYYDDREEMFDNHSYAKGGLILRMLKSYVGDEAFFAAVKTYLSENKFQSVEIHNLRLAFEKVTGEDLNWFFNQWFYQPGHPIVKVEDRFESDTLYISIEQIQDISQLPVYKLPLYIDIYLGDKLMRYPLVMEDVSEELVIPFPSAPDLIVFDSEFQLVGEIIHEKPLEHHLFQLKECDNLVGRYEAFVTLAQSEDTEYTTKAIEVALEDQSFRIRSLAMEFMQSIPDYLSQDQIRTRVETFLSDSIAELRAGSLYALSIYNVDNYKDELVAAVNDKAYSVQGVALEGVLELELDNKEEIFEPMMKENQIDIMLPTADFINRRNNIEDLDWYLGKIESVEGSNLFFLMQYFAEFVFNNSQDSRGQVLPVIEDLAKNNSNYMVRYAAFQTISIINDSNDLDELLNEIMANEKDSRLIQLYKEIQEGW